MAQSSCHIFSQPKITFTFYDIFQLIMLLFSHRKQASMSENIRWGDERGKRNGKEREHIKKVCQRFISILYLWLLLPNHSQALKRHCAFCTRTTSKTTSTTVGWRIVLFQPKKNHTNNFVFDRLQQIRNGLCLLWTWNYQRLIILQGDYKKNEKKNQSK